MGDSGSSVGFPQYGFVSESKQVGRGTRHDIRHNHGGERSQFAAALYRRGGDVITFIVYDNSRSIDYMHIGEHIIKEITENKWRATSIGLLVVGLLLSNCGFYRPGVPDVFILASFAIFAYVYARNALLLHKKVKRPNREKTE